MKEIHVTLPDSSASQLEELARTMKATRNGLIRLALEQFFVSQRECVAAEDMRKYAVEMAEESGEFVKETAHTVAAKVLKATCG